MRKVVSKEVTAGGKFDFFLDSVFRLTFQSIPDLLSSDECRTKKAFSISK